MTTKATFDNIPKASLGQVSDIFLVRQNGVAVSQDRETLSASLGNSQWNTTSDYLVGSEVIHNSKRYRALQDNGVSFSNICIPDSDPVVWLDLQNALDNKYSPNNKPSANDIGALSLTGGTLTGALNTTTDSGHLFTLGESAYVYTFGNRAHIYTNGLDAHIKTYGVNGHIYTQGRTAKIFTDGEIGDIYTKGQYANIYSEGQDASIYTKGARAHIHTLGDAGLIYTKGANAKISTKGENAEIYTEGLVSHIYSSGNNASIFTKGENGHIFTEGQNADIFTEKGEIKEQGERVYSPNNKPALSDVTGLLEKIQELETRLLNLGG